MIARIGRHDATRSDHGAGRGIGLELARQYAARGDRVLAGCRASERAPGLRALVDQHRERVSMLPLEVTDGCGAKVIN